MVLASLTIADASNGRYVIQPGAPVATSVEALRSGKVTINPDYEIMYSVKVKGVPQGTTETCYHWTLYSLC
jgi:hypothetical protein